MKCPNALAGEHANEYGAMRLYLPCENPNHCEGDVNPTDDWPPHHYGCDCDSCMEFYRSLK